MHWERVEPEPRRNPMKTQLDTISTVALDKVRGGCGNGGGDAAAAAPGGPGKKRPGAPGGAQQQQQA